MRKVYLVTGSNSHFRDAVAKLDFSPVEITLPVEEAYISEIEKHKNAGFFVIEISEKNFMQELNFARSVIENGKVVCVSNGVNGQMKCLLLEAGISDLMMPADPKRTALYLKSLEKRDMEFHGRIAVLDDDPAVSKIIKTIASRFGYSPVFASSMDSLFEIISDDAVHMILVNIGLEGIDLQELIKKSYLRLEMKRSPVIAYKDMRKGIFVHEFISGLNRLTKVIMSLDELYSFMLDLLFRKEAITRIGAINRFADYEGKSSFERDHLNQIYFKNEKEIFSYENIFDESDYSEAIKHVNMLKKMLMMTDGLRWLKSDSAGRKSICGAGG